MAPATDALTGRGGGGTRCFPWGPPHCPTAHPIWGAGAPLEGWGAAGARGLRGQGARTAGLQLRAETRWHHPACPQCPLRAPGCSSTEPWGAAIGFPCQSPRTSQVTPSSILLVPKPLVSLGVPRTRCPLTEPGPPRGGSYLVPRPAGPRCVSPAPHPLPSLGDGGGRGDVGGAVPVSPNPRCAAGRWGRG